MELAKNKKLDIVPAKNKKLNMVLATQEIGYGSS